MVLRQIAINGNAGAFVDIYASIPCRRMELIEDDAGTGAQGLQVKSFLDGFTTTNVFNSGEEPLVFGHKSLEGSGYAPVLGYPASPAGLSDYAGGTVYGVGDSVTYLGEGWVCIKAGTVGITPGTVANWRPMPNYHPADKICSVLSNTVTATVLRVIEYD